MGMEPPAAGALEVSYSARPSVALVVGGLGETHSQDSGRRIEEKSENQFGN